MRGWILLIVGLLLLAGCAGSEKAPGPTPTPDGKKMVEIPNGTVRFVVIGDQGQGNEQQRKVAEAMRDVCYAQGCHFAITAGDNIYCCGVRNAYDEQFNEKFEEIYFDVPVDFYLVLGNHDNGDGGGRNPVVGDYQVEYGQRTDRPSTKWHMPARNYVHTFGDVTLIGMDSGPEEVSQTPVWPDGTRGHQLQQFVANAISKATTKWKFAFAHHPYISNAQHGDAGFFDGVAGRGLPYKQMIEQHLCGKIQVFFGGHDHSLQWLKPVESCAGTHHIVSGAGGASLYTKKATSGGNLPAPLPIPLPGQVPNAYHPAFFESFREQGQWGFFWIDVTGNTLTAVAYSHEGKELHRGTIQA